MVSKGNPLAEFCLTDRGRRDVLINLELLRRYGATNQTIIEEFNRTVGEGK